MKKILNILLKIVFILMIILTIFILINFIIHKIKQKEEYNYLESNGYINLVDVGEYKVNLYKYGNDNSKHKIIGLSGLSVNDYSIEMKYAMQNSSQDNLFVFIDRAGYGYSEDTKVTQSIEQIVNDYRIALKKSGIDAPYILMPHSLGGVYATYWESMYPEEIEGVIFIDSTELGINIWDDSYNTHFDDILGLAATKLGLQRLILHKYYLKLPSNYTVEDKKISDYLNINSFITSAILSERREMNNNTNKAFNGIVENNIPKIYINASTGYTTKEEVINHYEWVRNNNRDAISKKLDMETDEKINEFLSLCEEWRENEIIPYITKLGNTRLIKLPGNHMIFMEKPEELEQIITNFINELN